MKIETREDVLLCVMDMLETIGNDAIDGAEINWRSEAQQLIDFLVENIRLVGKVE